MNFLYPLFAFGTLTFILPVLIHFLTRRQKKRILYSDLSLLRKVNAEESRRYQWENLRLLILRCLICILLAILFTQPVLRKGKSLLSRPGEGTAALFVIDASRSMGASEGGVIRYERAKTQALSILDQFRGEDEVMVVFASTRMRAPHNAPTSYREEVREAIDQSEVTPYGSSFLPALQMGLQALQKSRLSNKEVYLFTDCQKTAFNNPIHWPEGSDTISFFLGYFPESLQLPNCELIGLEASPLSARTGEPVSIQAQIFSHGSEQPQVDVTLEGGPNLRLSRSVAISPGQMSSVRFDIDRSDTDVERGQVRIQPDALESDNSSWYAIARRRPLRIVMTQGGGRDVNLLYLQVALNVLAKQPILPQFSAEYLDVPAIPKVLGSEQVDILFIINPGRLDRTWLEAVQGWVNQGGHLVTLLGSVPQEYVNSMLVPTLLPVPVKRWEVDRNQASIPSGFDFDHPWLDRFEDQKTVDWSSVPVWAGWEFNDPGGASQQLKTLIQLQRGSPLLCQQQKGLGSITTFMSSLDDSWNGMPRSGLFLAFWGEYIRATGEKRGMSANHIAGAQVALEVVRKDERPAEVRVKTPRGQTHILPIAGERLIQQVFFARTDELGIYTVDADPDRVESIIPAAFAINPEGGEGDLSAYSLEELEAKFPSPFLVLTQDKPIVSQVSLARYGMGLWPYLLLIVVILMSLEGWWGRLR